MRILNCLAVVTPLLVPALARGQTVTGYAVQACSYTGAYVNSSGVAVGLTAMSDCTAQINSNAAIAATAQVPLLLNGSLFVANPAALVLPAGLVIDAGAGSLLWNFGAIDTTTNTSGFVVTNPGVYTQYPQFTFTPASTGSTSGITDRLGLLNYTIQSGGSGYVAGDIVSLVGTGCAGAPAIVVRTVTSPGGAITSSYLKLGSPITWPPVSGSCEGNAGTAPPLGTYSVTGGNGSGAMITTINYGLAFLVTDSSGNYGQWTRVAPPAVVFSCIGTCPTGTVQAGGYLVGTPVNLPGVTIRAADSQHIFTAYPHINGPLANKEISVKWFNAQGDGVTLYNAQPTWTPGGSTLTISRGSFNSARMNQLIAVSNGAPDTNGGTTAPYSGIITTAVSSTEVRVSPPFGSGVSPPPVNTVQTVLFGSDDTLAFQAAAGTGNSVGIPAGSYGITNQIILTTDGQAFEGDSRGTTRLQIYGAPGAAAGAVPPFTIVTPAALPFLIDATNAPPFGFPAKVGPIFRNISIAAINSDTTIYTALLPYPPMLNFQGGGTLMENVKLVGGANCLYAPTDIGGSTFSNLQIGCFGTPGTSTAPGEAAVAVLDNFDGLNFFGLSFNAYEMTSNQTTLYTALGAAPAGPVTCFHGAHGSTINMVGGGFLCGRAIWLTANANSRQAAVPITRLNITGAPFDIGQNIELDDGILTIAGGTGEQDSTAGQYAIVQTGGQLNLTGQTMQTANVSTGYPAITIAPGATPSTIPMSTHITGNFFDASWIENGTVTPPSCTPQPFISYPSSAHTAGEIIIADNIFKHASGCAPPPSQPMVDIENMSNPAMLRITNNDFSVSGGSPVNYGTSNKAKAYKVLNDVPGIVGGNNLGGMLTALPSPTNLTIIADAPQ